MGVLNSFLPGGGEFAHQKNCPRGWSGLELTDTLSMLQLIVYKVLSLNFEQVLN